MLNPLQSPGLPGSVGAQTPPRRVERRLLFSAVILFIVLDIILIGIFATTIITAHAANVATCQVTEAQLPSGLSVPTTALRSGHPVTSSVFQGQSLLVQGSTALFPLIQDGSQTLNAVDKTQVMVSGSSSEQGLGDLSAGKIGMAMSDIFASEDPTLGPGHLDDYIVAVVPFSLIVSNDIASKVTNLTTAQVRAIFTGAITNWQTIGGPNEVITVFNRTADSGTRISFEQDVLNQTPITAGAANAVASTDALVQQIFHHQGAIGYAATSDLVTLPVDQRPQIHPLCIDGSAATLTDIADGDYHFWSFEHLYVQAGPVVPTSVQAALLGFVCGGDFQAKDVLTYGYLHPTQLLDAVRTSHIPAASANETLMACATSAA